MAGTRRRLGASFTMSRRRFRRGGRRPRLIGGKPGAKGQALKEGTRHLGLGPEILGDGRIPAHHVPDFLEETRSLAGSPPAAVSYRHDLRGHRHDPFVVAVAIVSLVVVTLERQSLLGKPASFPSARHTADGCQSFGRNGRLGCVCGRVRQRACHKCPPDIDNTAISSAFAGWELGNSDD